ncbi:hypothetical protein VOLCADRAFT_105024 [Volvox carteri f. nagariensis]|uniref:Uncharacterized protein n=1 Tax=Volvox carteri f. nagariensis TaxID=3068 RepID=D8TXV3_VOLCA|nr:uncharacterized protein VOLCADRAFT_105024 [Volvox carteri f. nagariensis]EFJ47785.1 hypothetical protein VOLCADRAFT_105024 [Volvox carteri f. nagariensis]|eukprot:XP_002951256.1 hypothetical protein VOLCADRAFT_105024 [Volvox carteri f. nagariensis]
MALLYYWSSIPYRFVSVIIMCISVGVVKHFQVARRPRTAGLRLCDCGAVEDEMHVFVESPAYASSTRAKYERDLAFQGRNMRTIMTEAPPLALARFLSEVWETRHVALKALRAEADEGGRWWSTT